MNVVVADSSPLIALSRIGRLDLLREIFGKLLIPDAVWNEVVLAGLGKSGAADISHSSWIERHKVVDSQLVALLRQDLGAGESEAIVLARELGADVILMDEKKGRSAAKRLGIAVVGIVGVLINARQRGLLPDASAVVADLNDIAGFWLSAELKELVLGG